MKTKILLVGLVFGLVNTAATAGKAADSIPYYIFNAANVFKLDVNLLYALCAVESKCRANALNKNDGTKAQKARGIKEHSHGLFQIKLATARGVGFTGTRQELMKPDVNTWYAAKLLSTLYTKYKTTEKVLSAYNAGRVTSSNREYVYLVLSKYAYYRIDKHF